VETDTNLLLYLLTMRVLGGQAVPAASAPLKSFKPVIARAKSEGFVQERKAKLPVTKAGKTTLKNAAVLDLTEKGEDYLRQSASPEALAATTAAHLTAVRQSLEAVRKSLREEVLAALSSKTKKGDGSLTKELAELSRAVATLAAKLQKLESAVQSGPDDKVLARIDQAFDALRARFDRALQGASTAPGPPPAPRTSPPPTQPARQESLPQVLRTAYERLCCFREFQDGLVEIPRLYHEARRSLPSLTVGAFRGELESLWNARTVELHILNEVREAAESDKAIRRDDKLYYFVYWPAP
jgi:hypothetical protein